MGYRRDKSEGGWIGGKHMSTSPPSLRAPAPPAPPPPPGIPKFMSASESRQNLICRWLLWRRSYCGRYVQIHRVTRVIQAEKKKRDKNRMYCGFFKCNSVEKKKKKYEAFMFFTRFFFHTRE